MTTPAARTSAVAVVGDSAAVADDPDLGRCLTLIQDVAGVSTHVVPVAGTDVRPALRDLPGEVGAVFLPRALPEHATPTTSVPADRPADGQAAPARRQHQ